MLEPNEERCRTLEFGKNPGEGSKGNHLQNVRTTAAGQLGLAPLGIRGLSSNRGHYRIRGCPLIFKVHSLTHSLIHWFIHSFIRFLQVCIVPDHSKIENHQRKAAFPPRQPSGRFLITNRPYGRSPNPRVRGTVLCGPPLDRLGPPLYAQTMYLRQLHVICSVMQVWAFFLAWDPTFILKSASQLGH